MGILSGKEKEKKEEIDMISTFRRLLLDGELELSRLLFYNQY
jgi:hypothetical protein